ncbi:MAG: DUF4384 domain-containing protein [Pyrinomonadaceae bacterium]|nr:DUF4384 domain-containing protein [Pyrinomonadaceae bacterium]MDQ3172328.1 DUF4384 domain-containing protein [Acidobacteriota bacterium]
MRTRTILFLLAMVLGGFGTGGVALSFGQEQEEHVRGAFLTTRPKPVEKSGPNGTTARPSRRRPKATLVKQTTSASSTVAVGTASTSVAVGAKTETKTAAVVTEKPKAQKLGLGLTLFTRDANGLGVRADPSRVFRSGERVRVLLETNTDGYLYIFNTTDGGKPVMIYPNAELDEGGNYIQSHVPFEIPASSAGEERLRWFTFDKYAGAERLFFVFTRDPLPLVPIEDDLINYCKRDKNKCPIKPETELWVKIQTELSAPVQVAKSERYGKAQTAIEQDASTRGLGLSKDDPEPSLVMMRVSTDANILVAMLELIHK